MDSKIDLEKIFFSDPRLEFPGFLRFFWHLIYNFFYIIFAVIAFVFVLSDMSWLRWLGILFLLFLADRIYTINKASHSIRELNQNLIEGVNVSNYLSPKSFRIIEKSFDKALIVGGNFYLFILKILIADSGIRGALWRLEVSPEEFEQRIDEEIEKTASRKNISRGDLLEKTAALAKLSFVGAFLSQADYVEPHDIFAALSAVPSVKRGAVSDSADNEELKKIFNLFSVDYRDLQKALIFSRFRFKNDWLKRWPTSLGSFAHRSYRLRHRIMNRAWTAKPTPTLDKFSIDLTDLARNKELGFLIGHEKEYGQLVNILARPARPNVLLVGEPGSGREAIISRLAFEIIKDNVPEPLFDKRVVSLQITRLISGADPQEISKRVNKVMEEIASAGNVILFMHNIHNLIKTSGENYINAVDIILPVLTTDVIQVVGATYPKELKQSLESRRDFVNAFEIVTVEEISDDEAIELLAYESIILEHEYNVIISFQAIKESVVLAHKYFRQKLLPSSAGDLLREALAFAAQKGDKTLKADHIISVSERKINIPIHKAAKDEVQQLLGLEDTIHKSLIDQDEAVKAVSESLREYRSGLKRSDGPIAAFLFVGPTGVGKTELAKILAKTQFGSETLMIRFDMSEYQDKQSTFRFIGSPDGKISGSLTDAVIQKPYGLILLDEFEKANSDVLNLFLQVFDDGRLTDNLGKVVDFKNTIIIATSNANSDYIKEQLESGKSISGFKDDFKKKLTNCFRPELLNRFSDIIVFKNLSPEDIVQIARLQLNKLSKTLEENQGIILEFDDAVVKYVAKIGYDPVFGARPLRNTISDKLNSVLAEKILKGEVQKGGKIEIIMEGEKIAFK